MNTIPRLLKNVIFALALPVTPLGHAGDAPAVALSGPVTGGKHGWPFGAPDQAAVDAHGYVMEEFFLAGTAQSYRAAPGAVLGDDGIWNLVP
ncbi:MAG: alpha/beta hydrolase domain-containing protein, partial [Steroidobacteraceae bacterium]